MRCRDLKCVVAVTNGTRRRWPVRHRDSVALISDRATGRPRGFGFEKENDDAVTTRVQVLDGQDHDGRALCVNEA